jgi:hypothetical protein
MNPMLDASLRRNWKLLGAVTVLAVLVALHVIWFLPTAERYRIALKSLGPGAATESGAATLLPPRVFSFVSGNSLPQSLATERTTSGQLTVAVIEELSALAGQNGLTITMSEPGAVTPTASMIDVRVHLRVRGGYRQMVAFLDAVRAQGHVYGVERYQIEGGDADPLQLELWLTRLFLTQPERHS